MFDGLKNCDSILLACVDVDKMKAQIDISKMAATLSEAERARADAFQSELLKDRFIAGRFYLRKILGDELNISAHEIVFSTETNGKPFVANSEGKGGHFSFSRSHQYAVVGYSKANRIGVDTELVRSFADMELMAAEIFDDNHLFQWSALPQAEKLLSFYRGWTRKEAVVKVDGRGISDGVRQIEVPLGDLAARAAKIPLPHRVNDQQNFAASVLLTEWQANNALVISVARESNDAGSPTVFADEEVLPFGALYGTVIRRTFHSAD